MNPQMTQMTQMAWRTDSPVHLFQKEVVMIGGIALRGGTEQSVLSV